MPKRGSLKSAGKRQESATFLQRSDFDVALQFFACCGAASEKVKMTSALQKSRCCSAVSAAQHSENCSATSVFACGMLQGWGLEVWGLGLAERCACALAAEGQAMDLYEGFFEEKKASKKPPETF